VKIEVEVKDVGGADTWIETYECDGDPEKYARGIIDKFNNTLRPYEKPREFVDLKVVDDRKLHDWGKTNLITVVKGGRSYDTMKCEVCGITGKRFGLGTMGVKRDTRYKAEKYEYCNP
jgi:hypothetical protein